MNPLPEQSFAGADLQVAAFRQECFHMYFTCAQVKRLVDCFEVCVCRGGGEIGEI